ncbi:hypothetical protein D9X91_15940 [Falsibacillus albus]|uniref:Uncharacterized protein n=1 Tax=Falsibacillus albus TaxID=2478915 RepID=A0A3L7JTZ9_9BACI|nr:hypothetical protein D9X91_15940 [Falsibacillus albus]
MVLTVFLSKNSSYDVDRRGKCETPEGKEGPLESEHPAAEINLTQPLMYSSKLYEKSVCKKVDFQLIVKIDFPLAVYSWRKRGMMKKMKIVRVC